MMSELKLVTSWPPVAVTTGVTNEPDTVPRSMYRYSILALQFPAIRPSRPAPMVQLGGAAVGHAGDADRCHQLVTLRQISCGWPRRSCADREGTTEDDGGYAGSACALLWSHGSGRILLLPRFRWLFLSHTGLVTRGGHYDVQLEP